MKKRQHLVKNVVQAHRQKRKSNDQNGSTIYVFAIDHETGEAEVTHDQ